MKIIKDKEVKTKPDRVKSGTDEQTVNQKGLLGLLFRIGS